MKNAGIRRAVSENKKDKKDKKENADSLVLRIRHSLLAFKDLYIP